MLSSDVQPGSQECHLYKRDFYRTVDRTPLTESKVNNDSLYYEFLIHGGFIFVKLYSRGLK